MEIDELDRLAAEAFRGLIVRKDLVRQFRGQFPVPTYVVEFTLGRYCATTDEKEIAEGLEVVRTQLSSRTVRAGEDELIKSRARETGEARVIDIITARLDARSDSYLATLPSLRLTDVRLSDETVRENERMLTGDFYAEIDLGYDATIAQEKGGRPFQANTVRPIQLSTRGILDRIIEGRANMTTSQWKDFLLRSVGLEPERMSPRARDISLMRMVPFVGRNFNIANGQRGLVCQYDVVCFDEVSGVSFDQKDGVNIMKGYMESGEFSRGRESIRASGSIVMVGNFEVDIVHQQRVGHLLSPLPPEMRNDTAFMDRVHAYLPGWDVPKVEASLFTDHFGLVSDFLSEVWTSLRSENRLTAIQGRVNYGGALSGRDTTAVYRTVNGLLKLLYPNRDQFICEEDLEWAVRLAMECRRRVKEQQKRIGSAEFRNTHFSYQMGNDGIEIFVVTPELQSDNSIGTDPLPPGQVWAIGSGGPDENAGLYRIDVNEGPGSGVKIINVPVPGPFKESIKYGEQNLITRARELVGDRDPRQHEFIVQLRAFDIAKSGAHLGLPALLAFCSALLGKSLKGGLIAVGGLNLGGGLDSVYNAVNVAEIAIEKGATTLLIPISARRQLNELSDDMAVKISILFYADAREALIKALGD